MKEILLLKYGEIVLKGANKRYFEDMLCRQLRRKAKRNGNFEIYRNGCIIWKQGMTPETIDEPMSHLDLLPTVSNLFGLEFDSRLYMGRDVFSDAEPLVMFRNRSWITADARYNSQTGKAEFFSGAESDTYVKSINNEVGNRFAVSVRILDHDYWRLLFGEET